MPLAAALNAPLPHGFSPVRSLRVRTPPRAAALLAAPQVAPTGHRPPRRTARGLPRRMPRWCGEAVGGCAPAATSAAPSSAGLMAARAQRALQHLTRGDCSSTANAVSGASFATGHEIEQRRVPLAQRGAAAAERRRIPARGFARSTFEGSACRMSGLGGLNKSSNGVVVGLVQLATAGGRNDRTTRSANETHLRSRRQGAAQPRARWTSSCSPSTRCTACR